MFPNDKYDSFSLASNLTDKKNDAQEGFVFDIIDDEGFGSQDGKNALDLNCEKSSEDDGNHDIIEDAPVVEDNSEKLEKDTDAKRSGKSRS